MEKKSSESNPTATAPAAIGILERFARDKPLRSLLSSLSRRRSPHSPSAAAADAHSCASALSPLANSVVSRCAQVLDLTGGKIERDFEVDVPDHAKERSFYATQFLRYCCRRALHVFTGQGDYLLDRDFRCLSYDMMLAWEDHCTENHEPVNEKVLLDSSKVEDTSEEASFFYENSTAIAVQVDTKKAVGLKAFSEIISCCPLIADSMAIKNIFDVLTGSSGGLLHFVIYDKYLKTLDRVLKSAKSYMNSRFASRLNLSEGEIVLAVEGNTPVNPVLKHEGMSTWPGRFTITTHGIYFESFRLGKNNVRLVKYDLSSDSKQVVKRELTGPLGARIYDRAIMYSSTSLEEPVYFEIPELRGHSRRDYCLEIICEILQAHIFIRQFNLQQGIIRGEVLSKATLSIFQFIAIREALCIIPSNLKTILSFNLANRLPRGDIILEALYDYFRASPSPFYLHALGKLGFIYERKVGGCICCFGLPKSLQKALEESIGDSEKSKEDSAAVDLIRAEGFNTNLILMKELLFPVINTGKVLYSVINWENPWKSAFFLFFVLYLIRRGWFYYIVPISFMYSAASLSWHKLRSGQETLDALVVRAPLSKNPVEQIVMLKESVSRVEEIVREVNIALLKLRVLIFVGVPKATNMVVLALILLAVLLILVPTKNLITVAVVEMLTREMPLRKKTTEKVRRRFKHWWARIPVAPVHITRLNKDKKK